MESIKDIKFAKLRRLKNSELYKYSGGQVPATSGAYNEYRIVSIMRLVKNHTGLYVQTEVNVLRYVNIHYSDSLVNGVRTGYTETSVTLVESPIKELGGDSGETLDPNNNEIKFSGVDIPKGPIGPVFELPKFPSD